MKPLVRSILFTCALVLALGVFGPTTSTAEAATLVYADEFNGPLNTSVWQQLTPWRTRYTTGELQYYAPENVTFTNGNMRILTERRSVNGYNYASGIVTSLNKPFSYGYFESRFNMPTGKGLWPAFWLTNDRTHEIDMMEFLGEDPTRMYFTYHKGGNQLFQRYFDNNTDLAAGWHTVGMDWQPTYIRWYLDGNLVAEYRGTIISDPMYLIFNTSVGGAWAVDPDASTPFPQEFLIDYVRVYDQKPSSTQPAPDPAPNPTPDPAPAPAPQDPSKTSVYRFFNRLTGVHFYTASAAERDMVSIKLAGTYAYEGVAYTLNPSENTWPLYRFYNLRTGSHFYTVSRTERDLVLKNYPGVFQLEGSGFNVARTPDAGPAVYRFYNVRNGAHFYTASVSERDAVMANHSQTFTYEGPVFYLGQ